MNAKLGTSGKIKLTDISAHGQDQSIPDVSQHRMHVGDEKRNAQILIPEKYFRRQTLAYLGHVSRYNVCFNRP